MFAAKSKAFRARLHLQEHEVRVLQGWATMHCAMHTIFRSDRGATVLVGLRAAPQTSQSFARTIRSALRRAAVPTTGLRGHWLFLISEPEAISLCLDAQEARPGNPRASPPSVAGDLTRPAGARAHDGDDTRVIALG